MLVIRDVQMHAFQRSRDDAFVTWAAAQLPAGRSAVEAGGGRRLWSLSRRVLGLVWARRAAVRRMASLAADFLVLMVRRAPNFDDHPAVRAALESDVPREVRLLNLPTTVSSETWAEVEARRDDRAWEG